MNSIQKAYTSLKSKFTLDQRIWYHIETLDTRKSFGTLVRKLILLITVLLLNLGIFFSYGNIHALKQSNTTQLPETMRDDYISQTNTTGNIASNLSVKDTFNEGILEENQNLFYTLQISNTSKDLSETITISQPSSPHLEFASDWVIVNIEGSIILYSATDFISGITIDLPAESTLTIDYQLIVVSIPDNAHTIESKTEIGNYTFLIPFFTTAGETFINVQSNPSETFYVGESVHFAVSISNKGPLTKADLKLSLLFDKDTLELIDSNKLLVHSSSLSEPFTNYSDSKLLTLKPYEPYYIDFEIVAPDVSAIYLRVMLNDEQFSYSLNQDYNQLIGGNK